MSDQTHHSTNSGGNTTLAFILGAVVVAVAVIGYIVYTGDMPAEQPDVSIELPGGTTIEGDIDRAGN